MRQVKPNRWVAGAGIVKESGQDRAGLVEQERLSGRIERHDATKCFMVQGLPKEPEYLLFLVQVRLPEHGKELVRDVNTQRMVGLLDPTHNVFRRDLPASGKPFSQ